MSLRLVSVNIERSKHLDLVCSFLENENADVVCVQELCERDIPTIRRAAGEHVIFTPFAVHPADTSDTSDPVVGVGIFSRHPFVHTEIVYYRGSEDAARTESPRETFTNHALVVADIRSDEATTRIVTTHFTWTPDGSASQLQRVNAAAMFERLAGMGEFVLCGDFNAPRGGEIWAMITDHFKDNVPAKYATSIDASLHRAGRTRPQELVDKMVDGLFSTPGYQVSDVELHTGVSDHCAITATISKSE
jgi:endonuclease/exonuclease/phosphatase family metal-dependent hydrolase